MQLHIFKTKRKRKGKIVVSRTYYGRYRLDSWPAGKSKQVNLGVTDKRVAEKKLAEIVETAEKEEYGIIPKKSIIDAAFVKLTDHMEEYISDCKVRKLSRDYIKRCKQRINILLNECNWKYAKDVTSGSFISWRSKKTTLTPKTLNDYKTAINSFMEWLKDTDRIEVNPLKDKIKPLETKGNESFQRRALSHDEIVHLLKVSEKRKVVYLFALYTGLRRGEIQKLLFSDLFLDEEIPYVKVRAATTKNKQEVCIPLHEELTAEIRKYISENTPRSKRLFRGFMPNRGVCSFNCVNGTIE